MTIIRMRAPTKLVAQGLVVTAAGHSDQTESHGSAAHTKQLTCLRESKGGEKTPLEEPT